MEETDAISDCTARTWMYASYLNLLDPLRKLERTSRLADGRNLGVYRTNDGYPRVTGQRRLQHPRQLGVPERHMVTGPRPPQ